MGSANLQIIRLSWLSNRPTLRECGLRTVQKFGDITSSLQYPFLEQKGITNATAPICWSKKNKYTSHIGAYENTLRQKKMSLTVKKATLFYIFWMTLYVVTKFNALLDHVPDWISSSYIISLICKLFLYGTLSSFMFISEKVIWVRIKYNNHPNLYLLCFHP